MNCCQCDKEIHSFTIRCSKAQNGKICEALCCSPKCYTEHKEEVHYTAVTSTLSRG